MIDRSCDTHSGTQSRSIGLEVEGTVASRVADVPLDDDIDGRLQSIGGNLNLTVRVDHAGLGVHQVDAIFECDLSHFFDRQFEVGDRDEFDAQSDLYHLQVLSHAQQILLQALDGPLERLSFVFFNRFSNQNLFEERDLFVNRNVSCAENLNQLRRLVANGFVLLRDESIESLISRQVAFDTQPARFGVECCQPIGKRGVHPREVVLDDDKPLFIG